MIGPFSAKITSRELSKFVVNQRHEMVQGRLISFAPFDQQLGYCRRALLHKLSPAWMKPLTVRFGVESTRPTRRERSRNRESDRRPSSIGSTLIWITRLSRCLYARSSHSNAVAVSPR